MKQQPPHIIDELLAKLLAGEASDSEERQAFAWLEESDDNKQYFAQFSLIWQQAAANEQSAEPNADEAWRRFKTRRDTAANKPTTIRKINHLPAWLKVAAMLALIAGYVVVSKTMFNKPEPQPANIAQVNKASNNAVRSDTLPDGSVFILNKQSKLTYPNVFSRAQRNVTLEGEAFFKVTPDKTKPFIISVNNILVKVVGTSFNVKSNGGITTVTVATGKVEVISNKASLFLLPGEETIVHKNDTVLTKKQRQDKLYDYYFTQSLVFDNTPLWQVTAALENAYGTKIIIEKNSLRNLPLTTTFQQQSLDFTLNVIAETFGITVEKRGDSIILR